MWSLLHGQKIKFSVLEVISAFWFLTFELPLLFEVPKEPDVDDERHDGRQGDAEAHEDGEALAEGDRVLPLLVVCGQIRKLNKRRALGTTPNNFFYRGTNKGLYVLLRRTQAEPLRTVKQEQEEISRNHVQTFICLSVHLYYK